MPHFKVSYYYDPLGIDYVFYVQADLKELEEILDKLRECKWKDGVIGKIKEIQPIVLDDATLYCWCSHTKNKYESKLYFAPDAKIAESHYEKLLKEEFKNIKNDNMITSKSTHRMKTRKRKKSSEFEIEVRSCIINPVTLGYFESIYKELKENNEKIKTKKMEIEEKENAHKIELNEMKNQLSRLYIKKNDIYLWTFGTIEHDKY